MNFIIIRNHPRIDEKRKENEQETEMKSEIFISLVSSTFNSKTICYINQLLPLQIHSWFLAVALCVRFHKLENEPTARVDLRLARLLAITSDYKQLNWFLTFGERFNVLGHSHWLANFNRI